jgi:putative PIN family toxin of toxin-antitoxin system
VIATAVYDCMLFFQAAARPYRVQAVFQPVHDGTVRLCLSPEILVEICDVLTRPELRAKFPALTPEAVNAFLAIYIRGAIWAANVPQVYTVRRDPRDSKSVNLALAAGAPYLVTRDKDLLDRMLAETPEGRGRAY